MFYLYPLARGVAPLIVAVVSLTFLRTHLGAIELTGIAIIGTGKMSLSLVRRSDGFRNYIAAFLAIVTGGFIAAFSLVGGLGARVATTALGFYGCLSILNTIFFSIVIRFLKPGAIKTVSQKNLYLKKDSI